jgi:hypothetical protein
MELEQAEAQLSISLPNRHRQAMLDSSDPIHDACDFLVPDSPYELLRWAEVNEYLHAAGNWPPFLVAFASNGCGDYFAYDIRQKPTRIIYIDPDRTVEENLCEEDKLEYDSFESWYESRFRKRGD